MKPFLGPKLAVFSTVVAISGFFFMVAMFLLFLMRAPQVVTPGMTEEAISKGRQATMIATVFYVALSCLTSWQLWLHWSLRRAKPVFSKTRNIDEKIQVRFK